MKAHCGQYVRLCICDSGRFEESVEVVIAGYQRKDAAVSINEKRIVLIMRGPRTGGKYVRATGPGA